jgi:hypothetical protein
MRITLPGAVATIDAPGGAGRSTPGHDRACEVDGDPRFRIPGRERRSMSTPFSILEIGRRINSLSVAYCDLDDDPDIQQSNEHRPIQFNSRSGAVAKQNHFVEQDIHLVCSRDRGVVHVQWKAEVRPC